MRVVLSGASGFVGGALLRHLIAGGHDVLALVRRASAAESIRAIGGNALICDLTAPESLRKIDARDAVIIHVAAKVELSGPWRAFRAATIEGTRNLLNATLAQSPRRVVYVSSAAVYGPVHDGTVVSAATTAPIPAPYNSYARAKYEAEKLLRGMCEKVGAAWSIARLGFVYGPGHEAAVESYLDRVRRDRVFVIGGGENRIAMVYVDDALSGIEAAATHPNAVSRVLDIASEEAVTQRQYVESLAYCYGPPPKLRKARLDRARWVVWFFETRAKLLGKQPPATRALLDVLCCDSRIDIDATRKAIAWEPDVAFVDGVRRIKHWYETEYRGRESVFRSSIAEHRAASAGATR